MGPQETQDFLNELLPQVEGLSPHIWVAPPFTSIAEASLTTKNSAVCVGAQNMSAHRSGAYTGEVSPGMLKECGASFVLLGHSERRHHFHERNEMIGQKVKLALEEELTPVLCIGETEEERERGTVEAVLKHQLKTCIGQLTDTQVSKVLIAYEPVWAIGTGKTATPEIAEETHALCRSFLEKHWNAEVAIRIPILYGGSVKPENTGDLMQQPNIDGALVGGASLNVTSFREIIKNTEDLAR